MLLKDKRCTSMRSKCARKPDRENKEAILQYSQDSTPMNNTGSHFLTSDGENTTSYCTTGSPWRRTSTKVRELKEFRLRMIAFLQQILKEEHSNHSINDPALLKRKENAKDSMTSTWQEPNKNTEVFLSFSSEQAVKNPSPSRSSGSVHKAALPRRGVNEKE